MKRELLMPLEYVASSLSTGNHLFGKNESNSKIQKDIEHYRTHHRKYTDCNPLFFRRKSAHKICPSETLEGTLRERGLGRQSISTRLRKNSIQLSPCISLTSILGAQLALYIFETRSWKTFHHVPCCNQSAYLEVLDVARRKVPPSR